MSWVVRSSATAFRTVPEATPYRSMSSASLGMDAPGGRTPDRIWDARSSAICWYFAFAVDAASPLAMGMKGLLFSCT